MKILGGGRHTCNKCGSIVFGSALHHCELNKLTISNKQQEEDIHSIMERVSNVLKNSEGLHVEVLAFAFQALKLNPELTVNQALEHGFGEWVK